MEGPNVRDQIMSDGIPVEVQMNAGYIHATQV